MKQQSIQCERAHKRTWPGLTKVSGRKKSLSQGKFSESQSTGPAVQELTPRWLWAPVVLSTWDCFRELRQMLRECIPVRTASPGHCSIPRPLQQHGAAGPAAALFHCPTALSAPPAPGPTESSGHSSGQLPWCLHRREDKRPKLRHLRLCCWVPGPEQRAAEAPHCPERVKSYRMEESWSRTSVTLEDLQSLFISHGISVYPSHNNFVPVPHFYRKYVTTSLTSEWRDGRGDDH